MRRKIWVLGLSVAVATITIGESVVRVVQVQGTRVKLAIEAPDSVRIIRGELPLIAALPEER